MWNGFGWYGFIGVITTSTTDISLPIHIKCPIPELVYIFCLRNNCTMACPPERGDNPRALASGLSYVQVDKHGITILYDHAHHKLFCA